MAGIPAKFSKHPHQLLTQLVVAIHENPGATKADLAPIVRPFHNQQYDPAKAKEADFGRYFNEALKKAGAHGNQRQVRFFKKDDGSGHQVNAHAIISTTNDDAILHAQIQAIRAQMAALARRLVDLYKALKFKKQYGKTIATVVDGEIVERTEATK